MLEPQLIRLPQVMQLTTLSRTEIYRRVKEGTFPAQRRISHKMAVWRKAEVDRWVEQALGLAEH